ncbi:cobalt import ATP-binding protein CbiO [Lancefieldella rimae]|nr:cobalt import ATP-binding protein CbiO [Lancefieldella rimae]
MELSAGERVVLLGSNGSGKTTLARLMNGSLVPTDGEVCVDGTNTADVSSTHSSLQVGLIRQDPANQLISASVFEEAAFGPSHLGLSQPEVLARAEKSLELCGIAYLRDRTTYELSGGQQQLLAFAATLALSPHYLVLDEVYVQLDARTRTKIRSLVTSLVSAGLGVLELSHSVESLFGASRVLWLHDGRIAWSGSPNDFLQDASRAAAAGLMHTGYTRVLQKAVARGFDLSAARDMKALGRYLRKKGLQDEAKSLLLERSSSCGRLSHARLNCDVDSDACLNAHTLALRGASLTFETTRALDKVSLESKGELVLLTGRSGSGKTTAARVLAGVLEADEGKAVFDGARVSVGSVGLAFQNPENQVFADTVFDDIAYGPRVRGFSASSLKNSVHRAAHEVDVDSEILKRSPFELSGGQLRRVALAGLVACHFDALVLDEPTAGLDGASRQLIRNMVRTYADHGVPAIVITHDVGEWLEVCDRVAFMAGGKIVGTYCAQQAQFQEDIYEKADLEAPPEVQLLMQLRGGEDFDR